MKNLLLILTLTLTSLPLAHARDGGEISVGVPGPRGERDTSQEILNHPVVQGSMALLNAGQAGSCRMPQKEDIHWMCTGAIPPVKEPTILPNSCGFRFEIECEHSSVAFSGRNWAR